MSKSTVLAASAGAAAAVAARSLFVKAVTAKLNRDVARINDGDYGPLLSGYADDAVLVFADGEHRWAGRHEGRAAIERFLKDFVNAGVKGEIKDVLIAGPPWAMRMHVRFDDGVTTEDGEQLYRNRTVLCIRSRNGKIVLHEDFYEDTERIAALDRALTERSVEPVAA